MSSEEQDGAILRLVKQRGEAKKRKARGKADVLYVADAFEVMRHLNRLLRLSVPGNV